MQIRRNIGIATYHKVVRRAGKIFTYTRPYKSGAQDADTEESFPSVPRYESRKYSHPFYYCYAARNDVRIFELYTQP